MAREAAGDSIEMGRSCEVVHAAPGKCVTFPRVEVLSLVQPPAGRDTSIAFSEARRAWQPRGFLPRYACASSCSRFGELSLLMGRAWPDGSDSPQLQRGASAPGRGSHRSDRPGAYGRTPRGETAPARAGCASAFGRGIGGSGSCSAGARKGVIPGQRQFVDCGLALVPNRIVHGGFGPNMSSMSPIAWFGLIVVAPLCRQSR